MTKAQMFRGGVALIVLTTMVTVGGWLYLRSAFGEAVLLTKTGDHEAALKRLEPLARLGHAKSQYLLGEMYAYGWGVNKDDDRANKWFRRAALWSEGLADPAAAAQFFVGENYANGIGVPVDEEEALRWYRLAASGGYPRAVEVIRNLERR